MKLSSAFVLSAAFLLIASVSAFAGGSSCALATPVMADGRITDFDFVPASPGTLSYQFTGSAGRSYSIEMRQDYDDLNSNVNVTVFSDSACGAAVVAGLVDTSTVEPALPASSSGGQRFSFIPTASGQYYVKVTNADAIGHYISVSVADTTLFNPRWSASGQTSCTSGSCAGFHTEFGIVNTTSSAIHVTIKLFDSAGNVVASHGPDTVAAKGTQFYDTRDVSAGFALNVPKDKFGSATVVTDAPAGAVLADVYVVNASFTSGPWIQTGRFETRRDTH